MAQRLSDVAQLVHDSFYQEFRPATAFFRLEHFKRFCVLADAKLKQDEYQLQVYNNMRMRRPNAPIVLSADNFYTEVAPVAGNKAKLKYGIMSFPGVGENVSVTQVQPEGNCQNFMRVTQATKWQVCQDKDMVYWYPVCDGIEFLNLNLCNPKSVTVTYIPSFDAEGKDNVTINESRGWAIVNMITLFLKTAKDGIVFDKSNNSNPNVSLQTEMDKFLTEALSRK